MKISFTSLLFGDQFLLILLKVYRLFVILFSTDYIVSRHHTASGSTWLIILIDTPIMVVDWFFIRIRLSVLSENLAFASRLLNLALPLNLVIIGCQMFLVGIITLSVFLIPSVALNQLLHWSFWRVERTTSISLRFTWSLFSWLFMRSLAWGIIDTLERLIYSLACTGLTVCLVHYFSLFLGTHIVI